MNPENQTDHIALLALTISGVLMKRLNELGQLDEDTSRHLRQLVKGVRTHAKSRNLTDLNVLFDNIDSALAGEAVPTPA
jgi:hypothetical protein